eukprot:5869107-Prymnesium_polylepis.1
MPRVDRAIAQLASRPMVAWSAVAVALGTCVGAALAGSPVPVKLAAVRLNRRRRVAPVADGHVERCDRGVRSASNAWNRIA